MSAKQIVCDWSKVLEPDVSDKERRASWLWHKAHGADLSQCGCGRNQRKAGKMGNDRFKHSMEAKEVLRNIVRAVGGHFKSTWSPKEENPDSYWAGLVCNDGRELSFSFDSSFNPKRLNIHGCYPHPKKGTFCFYGSEKIKQDNNDSISVGWDRDPAAIAKEIDRRLIPGYNVLYAEAVRRIAATEDYETKKVELYRELCDLTGELPRMDSFTVGYHLDGVSLRVEGPDSVRAEHWYMTAELARRILPVIKQYQAEKAASKKEGE